MPAWLPAAEPTAVAVLALAGAGDAVADATRTGNDRTVTDIVRVRRDRVRRIVWRWELPLPMRSDTLPPMTFVLSLAGRAEGPLAVEIVVPAELAVHWHALSLTGDLNGEWFPLEPLAMESTAGSIFGVLTLITAAKARAELRKGYLQALGRFNGRFAEICQRNRVERVLVDTSRPMGEVFVDYLNHRSLAKTRR